MKHTPTPWHVAMDEQANFRIYSNSVKNPHAVVYNITHQESESLANARLIHAAPDLLEACKDVLKYIDETGVGTYEGDLGMMQVLRAAITKAEPQES